MHGSLGWFANGLGQVIRTGGSESSQLVYPEHLKYDRTQSAPYSALFDRLKNFLRTPDTLLIVTEFSFADAHISALLSECLAANPSANVFAFQFKPFDDEGYAAEIARRRGNMSVYGPDKALINGIVAPWKPGDPPTRDWDSIRSAYWSNTGKGNPYFTLGKFSELARFLASSRSTREILSDNIIPFASDAPLDEAKPAKELILTAGTSE